MPSRHLNGHLANNHQPTKQTEVADLKFRRFIVLEQSGWGAAANKQHVALASVSSRHDLDSTLLFLIGSVIEQNIVEEINLHHKVAY